MVESLVFWIDKKERISQFEVGNRNYSLSKSAGIPPPKHDGGGIDRLS